MGSHIALIMVAFAVVFVVPVLWMTWHSIRSDDHTPPPLQDGDGEQAG